MCPRDHRDTSESEGAGGDSSSMRSGATTTVPSEASSPSPAVSQSTEIVPEASGSPAAGARDERWVQVRDKLIKLVRDGNTQIERFGDMITDEKACTRFLRGGKGNVGKAVDMFKAHLEWRIRYNLETIVDEDFSDLKGHGELYWGGCDKDGVMTLMWQLRKHDAKRTDAKRFVRFFVHQIESGLRTCESYPNGQFNIMVDLDKVGYANTDQEMGIILQAVLAKNYPKVRKGLYVFPINWFVQLFWDTLLKPLLATLQPDIEDKICPLTGDWKAKLRERYDVTEIEKVYGGELDLRQRPPCKVLPYKPIPFWELADAAPHVDGETQGHVGVGRMECEVKQGSDADREEAPLTSQGQVGSEDVTTGASGTSTSEAVLNGLSLVTGGLAPDGVCGASSSSTDRAKCASVGSGRHESEDEFMTPVASPMERPSLDASPICPTTGQQVHDGMADGRALGERSREAIFVGANGKALEDRKGMTRASSELELVAHQKQVLEAAHGGVWDAHSSTERAALMKAAIHSMTEAGLDEEVAQKVFELDSAAVARILSAAASCAQDASPRAASSDELLRVAQEYGLVGNRTPDVVVEATEATTREPAIQPQTPPRDPSHAAPSPSMGVGDERLPPSNELLITDDYLRAIHSPQSPERSWTPERDLDTLDAVHQGSGGKLTAGRPKALASSAGSANSLDDGASPPAPAVRAMEEKRGRKRGEEARGGRGSDGGDEEEGTFDLVFSQLEILKLLQVVLR